MTWYIFMNNRITFLSTLPLNRHACPYMHTLLTQPLKTGVCRIPQVRGLGKLGANEMKRASDSPLHLQQSSPVLNPLFILSLLIRLSLTKGFGRRIWEEEKEKEEDGGRRKEGRKRGSRRSSKPLL